MPVGRVRYLVRWRSARPSSKRFFSRLEGEPLVAASPPPERPSLTPVPDDRPLEALAVVTEAEAEMPLPSNPQTFFLGGIFAFCVFAALYLASPIILPVVLAFVLKLLLQPAVHLLQRVHLPRPVGAFLTVLLAIGTLGGVVAGLSVPAANWATKLPEGIPRWKRTP